jgi:hypothetical protein
MPTLGQSIKALQPDKRGVDGFGSDIIDLNQETDIVVAVLSDMQEHIRSITEQLKYPISQPSGTSRTANFVTDPTRNNQATFLNQDQNATGVSKSPLTVYPNIPRDLRPESTRPVQTGYGIPEDGLTESEVTDGEFVKSTAQFASAVLSNNRFSGIGSGSRFVNDEEGTRAVSSLGNIRVAQNEAGVYKTTPDKGTKNLSYDNIKKGSKEIAVLRNVALELMVSATGKNKIAQSLGLDSTDSNTRKQAGKSLLPSGVQMGVSLVDGANYLAGNAEGASPDGKSIESLGYAGALKSSGQSYGVMNSPLEPYQGGFSSATFQALMGAVSLIGIAGLFSLIRSKKRSSHAMIAPGGLLKGKRTLTDSPGEHKDDSKLGAVRAVGNEVFNLGKFNFPELTHAYDDCIFHGFKAFYGLDLSPSSPGLPAGQLILERAGRFGTAAANLAQNPQYYAVILKSVMRDFEQIKESFSSIAGIGINPLKIISSVSDIISALADSKIFKFLNVIAAIGDAALNEIDGSQAPSDGFSTRGAKGISDISNLLSGFSPTRIALLIPQSFANSAIVLQRTGNNSAIAGTVHLSALASSAVKDKISIEQVRELERQLDSDYFPFTIHDMRTNELLQFNSFLSDFKDGFSVDYSSETPYGRVDPVMSYKSTKRSINFSFYLVATNPTGHDFMWVQINKLTTLLYPQYSKGRLIEKAGSSFRMPFSQVFTNSPMVRIRIGEIMTNNYSRFNIQRLFGTGEASGGRIVNEQFGELSDTFFKLINEDGKISLNLDSTLADTSVTATEIFKQAILNSAEIINYRYKTVFQPNDFVFLRRGVFVEAEEITQSSNGKRTINLGRRSAAKTMINVEANSRLRIVKRIPKVGNHPDLYQVKAATDNDNSNSVFIVDHHSLYLDAGPILTAQLASVYEEKSDVSADPELGLFSNTDFEAFSTAAANFFAPENNPIVRSFENSMSQGLAGFITKMDMDYDISDSLFETTPGSRAPMGVKISIDFTPIHDIAPGLDADGMNRAPIYKVGPTSRMLSGDNNNTSVNLSIPISHNMGNEQVVRDAKDSRIAAADKAAAFAAAAAALSAATPAAEPPSETRSRRTRRVGTRRVGGEFIGDLNGEAIGSTEFGYSVYNSPAAPAVAESTESVTAQIQSYITPTPPINPDSISIGENTRF